MASRRDQTHHYGGALLPPLFDMVCWSSSLLIAAYFRYRVVAGVEIHARWLAVATFSACLLQIAIGWFAVYRYRWQVGSFEQSVAIAMTMITVGSFLVVGSLFQSRSRLSIGSIVAATLMAIALAIGTRVAVRYRQRSRRNLSVASITEPLVIYGAGAGGIAVIEAMFTTPDSPFTPVALLDDDPQKRNLRVRSIRVEGTSRDLGVVARRHNATTLLIAIANLSRQQVSAITQDATLLGLRVRVLPPLTEPYSGVTRIEDIRPLALEDIMGRRQVDTNVAAIADFLKDRVVLVTGAGGSIGSELCRSISDIGPGKLVMLDRDESALHQVQLSIEGRAMLDTRNLVVCDIRDRQAIDAVFDEHRPDIVFHAAALKHLPLLEMWPGEAVKSNAWGTANVLAAAKSHQVTEFVNISTDKAADPISVLGYSKRLAERLTASYASAASGRYLSVRFGNVLGSRGSMLTAFREQIAKGGPITVTDPNVSRFFMTIPEAVQLTLQAAALGASGSVLILEMGEPIRIDDVARQLAAESPEPIEIVYTGLRHGEKLHEQLFAVDETDATSIHPMIMSCAVPPINESLVRALPADSDGPTVIAAMVALCESSAHGS